MILKLYDGQVELEFNERGHRYKITKDGQTNYTTGVTSILRRVVAKEGLMFWAVSEAVAVFERAFPSLTPETLKDVLEEARTAHTAKKEAGGDVGTLVHKAIENYIAGVETSVPKEAEKPFNAFLEWVKQSRVQFTESELPVYSRQYDYAGTLDAIGEIDGKKYIIDFKTSEPRKIFAGRKFTGQYSFYPEHFVQVGAYHQALQEESGEDFDGHIVVYITKQGMVFPFKNTEVEKNKLAFLSALGLFRRLGELENV